MKHKTTKTVVSLKDTAKLLAAEELKLDRRLQALENRIYDAQVKFLYKQFGKKVKVNLGWMVNVLGPEECVEVSTKIYGEGQYLYSHGTLASRAITMELHDL